MAEHRSLRLHLAGLADRDGLVDGHDFIECEIAGPAILLPISHVAIVECSIPLDFAEIDAQFWVIPSGRHTVRGVVGLTNVSFLQCIFDESIAWAQTRDGIQELKNKLLPPQPDQISQSD